MDGDCVSLDELTKKVQRATDRCTIISSGVPVGNANIPSTLWCPCMNCVL